MNRTLRQTVRSALLSLLIAAFASCATYYDKTAAFQQNYVMKKFDRADELLSQYEKSVLKKDRLLFLLQKGMVNQMLQNMEESNRYFEEAYIYTEDIRRSLGAEFISILTNPTVKPYRGEDFEIVLIHYMKALNFLHRDEMESALVECRRMNIKLNEMNDRYDKHKNRYKQDAFALNVMGMIYEASGDINNAFIAYRNSYDVYIRDYKPQFGINPPDQLKLDILRTAYLNGFTEELRRYEAIFETRYKHSNTRGGTAVMFWHNGLGPVKDEWSINFVLMQGAGGALIFENREMDLAFPFVPDSGGPGTSLNNLKFVRVAFPQYLERKPYYADGEAAIGGVAYPFELGNPINAIAFKSLEDRMIRELSTGLLRVAIKQAAELAVGSQNQTLGMLLSIVNAISEKADTRNWQSLPYEIQYCRIPLEPGENRIKMRFHSPLSNTVFFETMEIQAGTGETRFILVNTVESFPLFK